MTIIKKKVLLLVPATVIIGLSVYLYQHPEMYTAKSYESTDYPPVTVSVPIGGTDYVNIKIDGINTELLETNKSTYWRFNDATVIRTVTNIPDNINLGYQLGYSVYKKYGDSYVSVMSDNKLLDVTARDFNENSIYAAATEFPSSAVEKVTPLVQYAVDSSEATVHDGINYLNKKHRYGKVEDILKEAIARLHVYGTDSEWSIYQKDNITEIWSGDEYVVIDQMDYLNSMYTFGNLGGLTLDTSRGDTKIKTPVIRSKNVKEFLAWCYYIIRR